MQLPPEVPLHVDRGKWLDALESLGIPARGHLLVTVEADSTGITVTYYRTGEDGRRVVGRDRNLARIRFDIGLTPVGGA